MPLLPVCDAARWGGGTRLIGMRDNHGSRLREHTQYDSDNDASKNDWLLVVGDNKCCEKHFLVVASSFRFVQTID
jgi:hypothetical protein